MVMATIRKLMDGEKPSFTAGEQQWDYLYSGDAGEIMARLGENGRDGRIYCLGSGRAQPLADYIRTIRDVVAPGAALGLGEIPYADKQVMFLQADISELKKDLSYEPQTAFADGIRSTYDWMREQ
jgi:nucleoside-diphosphate-sugar epimerase